MSRDTSTTVFSPDYTERSPLLVSTLEDENTVLDTSGPAQGSASLTDTVINLAKTCMGTGCLALPYAARQGGILLYVTGLFAIGVWNLYASVRLCYSLDLLSELSWGIHTDPDQKPTTLATHRNSENSRPAPPNGTATLGKVAWYAMGPPGLALLDALTFLLLMGIIIAYDDAIRAFLRETPVTTGNDALDAMLTVLVIGPLTLTDIQYLSKTSAAGLSVLALTLLVIAAYGWQGYDINAPSSIHWLPLDGLNGASNWFGCTVFGFGIVPLTFNFRDSMQEPKRYPVAAMLALLLVAVLYNIIGITLLILYPGVEGDVLSEIPGQGILPILTRISMAGVVVATAPLIAIPCAELVEGKMGRLSQTKISRAVVRFGICFLAIAVSVGVPEFVNVLTLVGSFCVAFVSFCIPPFLYIVLQIRKGTPVSALAIDIFMLAWGLTATFLSTAYIFTRMISE